MQRGAPLREVRLLFFGGHALRLLGEDISGFEEALSVQKPKELFRKSHHHRRKGAPSMGARTLPTLDLKRNYARVKDEITEALAKVLESQHFILGPEVKALEEEVEQYLGVPSAVGCASGSDALLLALMTLGIGEGDEVITTPFSFFATVSCIVRTGARPVFADVDPRTYNIRPDLILEKVTPRTKAVIPVHLFGQMVPLEALRKPLEERNIALVEDCAQSFGAWRNIEGKPLRSGAVGDMGCFSFFPTKNLGCYGDGGMVTTVRSDCAERLRRLRVHGADSTYFHKEMGLNSRLDAIQAAILRVRLRHVSAWNEERRQVAERYRLLFAEAGLLDRIAPPEEMKENYHIYHQYVVRAERRDALLAFLGEKGIAARVYYPLCLHLQPCFAFLGYGEGDMPVAEALTRDVLALPIFPELTAEEQEWVVATIAEFYHL